MRFEAIRRLFAGRRPDDERRWWTSPWTGVAEEYWDELSSSNCYGQLTARSGLAVVADVFDSPGWRTRLRVSGYSGAEELRVWGPGLELESDPVEGHRHFFNGEVEPNERGRASLRWVSVRLAEAGVAHRLELYDPPETETVLDSYEYGWSGADTW